MPVSTPGVDSPPTGKIPGNPNTPTENTVSRIIPNQNSGIEYSTRVVVVATLSKRSPRFHAARTPSHTPRTVASTVAVPTSNSVGPIRGTMTSQTGTLNCCEGSSGTNGILDVLHELLGDRGVELGLHLPPDLRIHVPPAGVERNGIAWQHPEQEEVEQDDEDQRPHRRQHP